MKKRKETELDFEIDKLTNSIENSLTGEVFDTEVTRILQKDRKQIKKADWGFDWHKEFKDPANEIYKLTTVNNLTIIQGLICFTDKHDHIFMPLIESAGHSCSKPWKFAIFRRLQISFNRYLHLKISRNDLEMTNAKICRPQYHLSSRTTVRDLRMALCSNLAVIDECWVPKNDNASCFEH